MKMLKLLVTDMADFKLPDEVPSLNSFYVYMTGGCNLACQHCWLTPTFQKDGSTGGHLDYELFALAIEEALPLGLRHVKLTGGEPLLHPEFIRFVDLLSEKKISLTMETNGVLMTADLARYLKQNSTLTHISVSLDGANPRTHDTFRGVKGSFEKTRQAIRDLVDAGIAPQVIMSIHEGNVDEIEALVHLVKNLGASSVKFNLIQPVGRGEMMSKNGHGLDIQRLIELGKWMEGNLQKEVSIPLLYSWPMAFYGIRRFLNKSTNSCGIFNILGILSTGHFAMCGIGTKIPELCYGDIGSDQLSNVWHENPMLQTLRNDVPARLEGVCSDCIFKCQCLGSCIAENYHQTHSLTAANWFCQVAKDAGHFPESRLKL
jgi:SynChlorMet cassette radical SAM/SPASM protein ScmF